MQFIHPLFLFALFSLAVPILIHLFNFRRFRKVYFTNVRFLSDIQQETKRQSRLKQLLILASRLLALACLVIAFAGPIIPSSPNQQQKAGKHAVSIYLDNSFSMEAAATDGRLFDVAKSKALEIAGSYQPSDLFQLLTNDFEGGHQRFCSREEFSRMVDEVQLSPESRNLSIVVQRQTDLLSGSRIQARDAFIISDFQKSFADLASVEPDSSAEWYLIPLAAEQRRNLYIDSISFESPVHRPGQMVRLKVHIVNSGEEPFEKVPVKLTINNIQKSAASFSVKAGSSAEILLSYTENDAGNQFGVLEIPDYPISYDDKFYFTYNIRAGIPVLCINGAGENSYLRTLFTSDSSFRLISTSPGKLDYNSLSSCSLVILNEMPEISTGLAQKCSEFVQAGGSLLVFPAEKMNRENINRFLTGLDLPQYSGIDTTHLDVTKIATESELYRDVFEKNRSGEVILPDNADLPEISRSFVISGNGKGKGEELVSLRDGRPLLSLSHSGKGKIYLFATPLSDTWTNFPRHTLFLPTMYQIAFMSNPGNELYYMIGQNEINLHGDPVSGQELLKIRNNKTGVEFIPGIRNNFSQVNLRIEDQVSEAGLYTLTSGSKAIAGLAFNYDRRESDTRCLDEKELKKGTERFNQGNFHILTGKKYSVADQIRKINQGTPLWKWFILLTLFFIACEILLIRFLKE